MKTRVSPLGLALALAALAYADGNVDSTGGFAGPASASVLGSLEPGGYRIRLPDGCVACEVWFRKDPPGLLPSVLIGVLSFPQQATDFRGQAIKAGSYTLRYAQMPSDGNHLGAAPTTDFLLLTPVADDTDASALPDLPALVKMSARTIGTNHPAVLNLAAVAERKDYPAVATDEHGHEVFHVKLKTAGGERPIGLVVKGQADQ
jgi:hypothetical protein